MLDLKRHWLTWNQPAINIHTTSAYLFIFFILLQSHHTGKDCVLNGTGKLLIRNCTAALKLERNRKLNRQYNEPFLEIRWPLKKESECKKESRVHIHLDYSERESQTWREGFACEVKCCSFFWGGVLRSIIDEKWATCHQCTVAVKFSSYILVMQHYRRPRCRRGHLVVPNDR